jgi:ubiquinone/menaquinone biosynthesis C-methylase UbiE
MKDFPQQFVCPHCLGALTTEGETLACAPCARQFPTWHDVPNFSATSDYYYGEIPRHTMRQLVEKVAKLGSTKAFAELLTDKSEDWRRYFLHYATDETRAAWQFLLHLPENGTALDFGCGWGNIALSLARNFKTVYAMDLVPERAAISAILAAERGLRNVLGVAGGNTPHLPFPDATFDLVALNGVLEWVATSFPQIADPRQAQLHVLREIARVLKPHGQLYIGIENRTGFPYFLGRPDEHCKLKFTTLMPRRWANRYSLRERGVPYRTYTYNWRGYRKLLQEAGLPAVQFYCPFPEYREFHRLIRLDRARFLGGALQPKSIVSRLGLNVCRHINVFREVSPTYSIVAAKTTGLDRVTDRLLREISVDGRSGFHLQITRTATVLLFTPNVVVELPLTPRAAARIDAEATNLRQIYVRHPSRVPEPIAAGEFQGLTFLARGAIPGISGHRFLVQNHQLPEALRQATKFITEFHRETSQQQVCGEEWLEVNFNYMVDFVCELGLDLASLKADCRTELLGKQVLNVIAHGDFSLQNLIFKPRGTVLVGVVDWDLANLSGWPMNDLLHLLVAAEYETSRTIANTALLAVLKRLQTGHGIERELLDGYRVALSVEPEQTVWTVQRYLLKCIYDKAKYGDEKIGPLIETLPADLAEAKRLTRAWLAK